LRKEIDQENDKRSKDKFERIRANGSDETKFFLKLSCEKGASSWLTATPSYDHGTILSKGEFIDAICIRYGWALANLPFSAPAVKASLFSTL